MEYIIQENLFREEHYDLLHESLKRLGLKHTTVRGFPFVDTITDISLIPDDFNNVEQEALDYAQSMVDIFQLADAFIIDVCLTENGWKIVECGNINVAGFYKSNIAKMIMAVEDKFN